MRIQARGLGFEVDDTGESDRAAVLLVAGMGMQLTGWPPAWVRGLHDQGYRVIRHDNRDIGLSSALDHLGLPQLLWASFKRRLGLRLHPPYTVQDMADDAWAVLDALGVQRAHVLGISMGGMIAQRMVLTAPQRALSLVSLMSSSGARGLPGPKPQVIQAMMARPAAPGSAQSQQNTLRFMRALASPAYAHAPGALEALVAQAAARSERPQGAVRHALAVMSDVERADLLPRIQVPTLVVHGRDDPILPLPCAEDTARRIPGAQLVVVDGMAHDLPPQVVDILLAHVLPFLKEKTPV